MSPPPRPECTVPCLRSKYTRPVCAQTRSWCHGHWSAQLGPFMHLFIDHCLSRALLSTCTHTARRACTHTQPRMRTHTQTCMHILRHACRDTSTHTQTRMHTQTFITQTRSCAWAHTPRHTCTHSLPQRTLAASGRKSLWMSRSCCTMCLEPQPTPSPTAASHLTGPAPETEDVPSSLSQDPLLRSSPNMGKPLFFPSIPLVPWPGCWEVSSGIRLAPHTQTQTLVSGWRLGLNPDLTDLLLPVCCWAKFT